ncbi:MAG: hypothetical protein HY550_02820 [Elusimicrobia bacterium]|nr:hypothetical protein [Elusimicrobiota bacterium]
MKTLIAFTILAAAVGAASASPMAVSELNSVGAAALRGLEIAGLPLSAPVMDARGKGAYGSEDLPKSHKVRKAAEGTDSQWGDEDIMNGVVHVRSGHMVFDGGLAKDRLAATVTEYVKVYFKYYDEQILAAPVKAETGLAVKTAVDLAALNIAKGFNYDTGNQENIKPLRAQIGRLTGLLGAEVTVLSAKSRAVIEDIGGDALEVGMVIFVNTRTGEYLAFYSREGNG